MLVLILFQRCRDMQQIEKLAHLSVAVCEKMGYIEGMARGLQASRPLSVQHHGSHFSVSSRHMHNADFSRVMSKFLASYLSSAACFNADAIILSARVLRLPLLPRRSNPVLMQNPCWRRHSALRKTAIPSAIVFHISFVWEIYLRALRSSCIYLFIYHSRLLSIS